VVEDVVDVVERIGTSQNKSRIQYVIYYLLTPYILGHLITHCVRNISYRIPVLHIHV